MKGAIGQKASQVRTALAGLGKRLDAGDDRELLVWVIPGKLACAHRPLRHHPHFGGSRKDLPPDAGPEVRRWAGRMKTVGIQSIISLIHPKELRHYDRLDLGAQDLIDFYRKSGFEVRHIPWEDPAHRPTSADYSFQEELARIRAEALQAFDELPKPVLLHCSAGIDRSSPVAAYIWANRACAEHHDA